MSITQQWIVDEIKDYDDLSGKYREYKIEINTAKLLAQTILDKFNEGLHIPTKAEERSYYLEPEKEDIERRYIQPLEQLVNRDRAAIVLSELKNELNGHVVMINELKVVTTQLASDLANVITEKAEIEKNVKDMNQHWLNLHNNTP